MKESQFVSVFENAAVEVMGNKVHVERGASLFYQLSLDRKLRLDVDTASPKRGSSAFETDICIFEDLEGIMFPRVAIEFKPKITTHDILTYSAKAGKHKRIYPCLRYGLLASELEVIPDRFFVHNENLDFFIAAKTYGGEDEIRKFVEKLIKKELEISRILEKIHFENCTVDYYRTDITFGKFGDLYRF